MSARGNLMKKFIPILLCLVMLISTTACSVDEPQVSTSSETTAPKITCSTPILYQVADNDGHILYLLGSIHSGIQEMYPLPEYLLDAYKSADKLALETHSSKASLADLAYYNKAMRLEDGATIRDYISEQTYAAALQILKENHAYKEELEQCNPIYWYQTIDQLLENKGDASTVLGVDVTLEQMAKQDRKPLDGVETYRGHTAYLTELSFETQCMMLEQVVKAYHDPTITQKRDEICKIWARGDISVLNTLLKNDPFRLGMTAEELPLYQEFYDAIKTTRDLTMVQYIKEALASGQTVFVCVGIAHVIGNNGIVDQLTQAGYRVEQV